MSEWRPSEEFKAAVECALGAVLDPAVTPDDSLNWMGRHLPIYLEPFASPAQAQAAGCPACEYLGMWSDSWPTVPGAPNGSVWLFERGVRSMGSDLVQNAYSVLTHEFGHALQRDHVLDAMAAEGYAVAGAVRGAALPRPKGCGCPGGR